MAPQHAHIPSVITDLVEFAGRVDTPALAQIAIAHAQFETIHPFVDGNGRTGRALVQAMLCHRGIARNITVPLSAGLLVNTESYFAALLGYRDETAIRALETLTERGVLAERTGAKRNRVWEHKGILSVLDNYAASIRRSTAF